MKAIGEVAEQLAGQADLFFDEGVRPIFGEALLRFRGAQPLVWSDPELGKHPVDRHLCKIDGIGGLRGRSRHCD
jgi:hypothetical protein